MLGLGGSPTHSHFLRAYLVTLFEQQFSHFKYTYTLFHTLFHSYVFQKTPHNNFQTTLPNTPNEWLDPRFELRFTFVFSLFFFFFHTQHLLGDSALFIRKKNFKNGSHDIIHIFKNYFIIIFSVFNFQFQQK